MSGMEFHKAARLAVYAMIPVAIAEAAAKSVWGTEPVMRAELSMLCVLIPLHVLAFGKRWMQIFKGEA